MGLVPGEALLGPEQAGQGQPSASQVEQEGQAAVSRQPGGFGPYCHPRSEDRAYVFAASLRVPGDCVYQQQGTGSASTLQLMDLYQELYCEQYGDGCVRDREVPDTSGGQDGVDEKSEMELYLGEDELE
ncbi:hypothetical protein NDU88_006293 [Pleurodeles waltl]|uniref:Uncharacterized protein n=1 Tax=Pleurodeles waltl TaxID=8319 RepID=A0AAV7X138_PLEWA|nr:hypothetical protein NDU88_006293 [Pleurodeles waltl]